MLGLIFATEWASVIACVEGLSFFGGLAVGFRHLECHHPGCHRPGRHPYKHLKYCWRHHPEIKGDRRKLRAAGQP